MDKTDGLALLMPYIIISIPFVIMNVSFSVRKGKNFILYGMLSIIPLIGILICFYLASLTDKSIYDKMDKIIKILESR